MKNTSRMNDKERNLSDMQKEPNCIGKCRNIG